MWVVNASGVALLACPRRKRTPCLQIMNFYMQLLELDEKCVKCALRTNHTTCGAFACGLQLQHLT